MDDAEKPTRRPPARLESLKIQKEQEVTRKEDIEMKMRQVEERRKVKQNQITFIIHSVLMHLKSLS